MLQVHPGIHPFNPDKALAEMGRKKKRNIPAPDLHQLLDHLSFSRPLRTGENFGSRPWLPLVLSKRGEGIFYTATAEDGAPDWRCPGMGRAGGY